MEAARVRPRGLSVKTRLVLVLAGFSLVATAAFSVYSYRQQRAQALGLFREQLETAAASALRVLPAGYHARIKAGEVVPPDAYRELAAKLHELSQATGVDAVYTMMWIDDKIVFTSDTGTPETFGTSQFADFLTAYDTAPEILREAFRGKTTHGFYEDAFGAFMSVFRPIRTDAGVEFVIGVDDKLEHIEQALWKTLVGSLAIGFVVFAVAIGLQYVVVDRIMRPLVRLTGATDALAARDFAADERERAMIGGIAARRSDEVGRLASSLAHMESRLQSYIASLAAETAARERVEQELSIARDIQMHLLPATFPAFPDRRDVDLYAMMEPARAVGGDLYDFFLIDDHRLFFLVGDVSDKGVPAALYMTIVRALFKTEILMGQISLLAAMDRVNRFLAEHNPYQMFATALGGVLDLRTGRIEMSDAGHEPPFLLPASGGGRLMQKKNGGLPLGLFDDAVYQAVTVQLEPGDGLLLYTDGVNEAMNPEHAQFTTPRIRETLAAFDGAAPPRDVIDRVLARVTEFVRGEPQSDDLTMLALRYRGNGSTPSG